MQSIEALETPIWAKNGHSQTIMGDLLPSPKLFELGDRLSVQISPHEQLLCRLHRQDSPFVFILAHGLTGDANAGYVRRLTNILLGQGHSVCRVNHRNCGEGLGFASSPYHSGRSEDLARVVYEIKELMPTKKVIGVGFSMSGNASLLLAAGVVPSLRINGIEHFQELSKVMRWSQADFTVAINPPVNLSKTTDRFLKDINRLYQWNFIRGFESLLQNLDKKNVLREKFETKPFMTIRQFDELYTSPRSGFENAEHYYQSCSSVRCLHQIATPTAILTAKDDPIVEFEHLDQAKKSNQVLVHAENNGGHMGFVSKRTTPLGTVRWMDYAIIQLIHQLTD